jgi:hypothetical protein
METSQAKSDAPPMTAAMNRLSSGRIAILSSRRYAGVAISYLAFLAFGICSPATLKATVRSAPEAAYELGHEAGDPGLKTMNMTSTLCSLRMPNSTLIPWRSDQAPSAPAMSVGFHPGKCCRRKISQAHSTGSPPRALADISASCWSTHPAERAGLRARLFR